MLGALGGKAFETWFHPGCAGAKKDNRVANRSFIARLPYLTDPKTRLRYVGPRFPNIRQYLTVRGIDPRAYFCGELELDASEAPKFMAESPAMPGIPEGRCFHHLALQFVDFAQDHFALSQPVLLAKHFLIFCCFGGAGALGHCLPGKLAAANGAVETTMLDVLRMDAEDIEFAHPKARR